MLSEFVWCLWRQLRATLTTFSGVNPNLVCSSLSGADAPKVFIPMVSPSEPVYLAQPKVDACSTATRAVTDGGKTLSLYFWSCCSNSSQHGMLTTRVLSPSAVSRSHACRQSATSLTEAIR